MANTSIRLIQQFLAMSPTGKQQSAKDVPLLDADLSSREKCTVSVADVVDRSTIFDCEGVFVDDEITKTRIKRFTFDYAAVTPQILARWAGYFFGAAAAPTGTLANEVQTLTRTGTVSGGTFTISLTLEGRTGISQPIAWNATAAAVQAALVKVGASIGQLIKAGDIVVSGDPATGIIITFQGRLANANLPMLVVNSASLTGGGSVTVAQTTAGDAKYIPFTRSTSDVKPLFSFALGFKTGSLATEKYYNAVCESFNPTLNRSGDVSLQVTVLANYDPEEVAGFTVPVCVNYTPLATADCRVQINGAWETLDVFAESITLNDNVPVDADTFGFDSVDPDVLERGDQPSYAITGTVFGVKSDPLGLIVAAEGKAEHITHFGQPGNRFSLIAPALKFKPQSNSRQFAGARNRSVIAFDGVPTRDGINAPVKGEFRGSQTTSFLLT